MPTKLPLPEINDIDLIETIVKERSKEPNKTYFTTYKDKWVVRAREYSDHCGNPENIVTSAIDADSKDKFINLYNSPKGIVKTGIINILRNHTLKFCPFCGEAGSPATLDHFLPKDKYPEYSILSANLVPMCDKCQGAGAKGSKVLDTHSKRLFLHPYYDSIEDLEILVLTIKPPYDKGTDFELNVNDNITDTELKALCERHIKTLLISQRYRNYFSDEYVRLKKLVKQLLKKGKNPDDLPVIIHSFYEKEVLVSVNYWDAVFYKSVLENQPLMNYLKSIDHEDYENENTI